MCLYRPTVMWHNHHTLPFTKAISRPCKQGCPAMNNVPWNLPQPVP